MVSIVALLVSKGLAERPYPADPTQVPTLGTPQNPILIDSRSESYPFFQFLRANAGRKVRLNVHFFTDKYIEVSEERGTMLIPGPDCPKSWVGPRDGDPITVDCNIIELKIDISDPRHGLFFHHGGYPLNGYFADEGTTDIGTGSELIEITPLTAVEAVS